MPRCFRGRHLGYPFKFVKKIKPRVDRQPLKSILKAFTLTELLVVIAILGGLAALVIPATKTSMLSAKSTKALSNLKQTGVLVANYAADNNNRIPLAMYWPSQFCFQKILRAHFKELQAMPPYNLAKGLDLPEIFYDPILRGKAEHPYGSFGVNGGVVWDNNKIGGPDGVGMPFAVITTPSQKVIYCSATEQGWASSWGVDGDVFFKNGYTSGSGPDPRHGGKVIALFADGHVEKMDVKNMDQASRKKHFILDP